MKSTFFTVFLCFFVGLCWGQKTQYSISFNSGLFSFYGQSAGSVSQIHFNDPTNYGYTNNPYGSIGGLCLGVSGQIKRISKKRWIYGLDAGLESMSSRIHIDAIYGQKVSSTYELKAEGLTRLTSRFINFFPFAGHRLVASDLIVDLKGGIDIAYCLNTLEKGKALSDVNANFTTWVERKTIGTDFRPRIQLSFQYKKFGFYTGLSIGLVNYRSGFLGGVNECYSRLVRFGWLYQLI